MAPKCTGLHAASQGRVRLLAVCPRASLETGRPASLAICSLQRHALRLNIETNKLSCLM
jgi:hypothetical protein